MTSFALKHLRTIILPRKGFGQLSGVHEDGTLHIELLYDEEWLAQYRYNIHGELKAWQEETDEEDFAPWPLQDGLSPPNHPQTHPLNYVGTRLRGLREADRLADWMVPLSVAERFAIQRAGPVQSGQAVLGCSESRVMAYARAGQLQLVCRRLGIVVAVNPPQRDEHNLLYDYDTIPLWCVHYYDPQTDTAPDAETMVAPFEGIDLAQPTDCLIAGEQLYIVDSMMSAEPARIIIWHIQPVLAESGVPRL